MKDIIDKVYWVNVLKTEGNKIKPKEILMI